MHYLKGQELEEAERFMEEAAKEAEKSLCKKSKRGTVIVKDGEIIGRGHNQVTLDEYCNPCIREDIHDNSRVELCSAIHAEQAALMDAGSHARNLGETPGLDPLPREGQGRETNAFFRGAHMHCL